MDKKEAAEAIQKIRERLEQGPLSDDVRIVFRIEGGPPAERREEILSLSGSGKAMARVSDALDPAGSTEADSQMDQRETRDLFTSVSAGLEGMSEPPAGFLPDSTLGSFTIEIAGETETFFFLADEEERVAQDRPVSSELTESVQRLRQAARQVLKKQTSEP